MEERIKFGIHRFMIIMVVNVAVRHGTVAVPVGSHLDPQGKDSSLGLAWALEKTKLAFYNTHF